MRCQPKMLMSEPVCCSESPRVPPGGLTTPSLSKVSCEKLAILQRQVNYFLIFDHIFDGDRFSLQLFRTRLDVHRFVLIPNLEQEVLPDVIVHMNCDVLLDLPA